MARCLVLVLVLILAMAAHSSGTWCICKQGLNDQALQKTLDYACGAGADCNPTHQNGPCFNPNTVRAHCNYAVNSYFQRKGQTPTSCDFSGTAYTVTSDPSTAGCSYPASASTTTPVSTSTTTPSTNLPRGGSPVTTTPSIGILGGGSNGLGPSGINNDMSDAESLLRKSSLFPSIIILFSGLVFWWA